MRLLESFCIAVSMFSSIPVKIIRWQRENMRYPLCFLPMIGMVITVAIYGWIVLWGRLTWQPNPGAAMAVLLPLVITGGLHMDGFADSVDATASQQPLEKRLAIMSDPHIGAFGVMGICGYLLLSFGLWSQLLYSGGLPAAIPALGGFIVSRSLGAVLIVTAPPAKKEGLVAYFAETADKWAVVVAGCFFWVGCSALLLWFAPVWGGVAFAASGVSFFLWRRYCTKQFGGLTGDLTGCFIQIMELGYLVIAVVGGGGQ